MSKKVEDEIIKYNRVPTPNLGNNYAEVQEILNEVLVYDASKRLTI